MLVASIGGKYLAAVATQKTFKLSKDEGQLIFGLSSASAAATLASVMVGYNIILSETETGEPIRLLNEHVLNGSILLILISCTISSFVSLSSANKIAEKENEDTLSGNNPDEENILLPIMYEGTVDKVVNLGLLVKASTNKDHLYALNIINEEKNESSEKMAEKLLGQAVQLGAAADVKIDPLKRYDTDVIKGVQNVIKEKDITDIIIGLEDEKGFSPSFVYNLYNGYLQNNKINVLVYHAAQPVSTIKTYSVLIPPHAHTEPGFFYALLRIWNIAKNSGATMTFYAPEKIIAILQKVTKKSNIESEFIIMNNWRDSEKIMSKVSENEGLILMMAKQGMASYIPQMRVIPNYLNRALNDKNYILIFPHSEKDENQTERRSVSNNNDFYEISKMISKIFK